MASIQMQMQIGGNGAAVCRFEFAPRAQTRQAFRVHLEYFSYAAMSPCLVCHTCGTGESLPET